MERCEKIPPEAFESRNRSNLDSEKPRVWPSVDREGKTLGDVEYIVPSPPERESVQTKTLSPSDLEAYVRSYQDPPLSQVRNDNLNLSHDFNICHITDLCLVVAG